MVSHFAERSHRSAYVQLMPGTCEAVVAQPRAGSVQLARQLLTECIVLSLAGGLTGAALAAAGVGLLRAVAPPGLPHVDEIAVDSRVLLFTLLVSAASGLVWPPPGVGRGAFKSRRTA